MSKSKKLRIINTRSIADQASQQALERCSNILQPKQKRVIEYVSKGLSFI
jgi:hypothetical protein